MAEIRSSLEIALEKAERLGRASKEELDSEKWMDQGRRFAAEFLRSEDKAIRSMLEGVEAASLSSVLKGATEVLVRNIVLPRDKEAWKTIRKALRGVVELKGSIAAQVVSQIEQILKSYEQTRDHYYEQLRGQMQGKLGGVQQAVAQQYGMQVAESIDVESLPDFQKEWSRLSSDIMSQFEQQLAPLKQYLAGL